MKLGSENELTIFSIFHIEQSPLKSWDSQTNSAKTLQHGSPKTLAKYNAWDQRQNHLSKNDHDQNAFLVRWRSGCGGGAGDTFTFRQPPMT